MAWPWEDLGGWFRDAPILGAFYQAGADYAATKQQIARAKIARAKPPIPIPQQIVQQVLIPPPMPVPTQIGTPRYIPSTTGWGFDLPRDFSVPDMWSQQARQNRIVTVNQGIVNTGIDASAFSVGDDGVTITDRVYPAAVDSVGVQSVQRGQQVINYGDVLHKPDPRNVPAAFIMDVTGKPVGTPTPGDYQLASTPNLDVLAANLESIGTGALSGRAARFVLDDAENYYQSIIQQHATNRRLGDYTLGSVSETARAELSRIQALRWNKAVGPGVKLHPKDLKAGATWENSPRTITGPKGYGAQFIGATDRLFRNIDAARLAAPAQQTPGFIQAPKDGSIFLQDPTAGAWAHHIPINIYTGDPQPRPFTKTEATNIGIQSGGMIREKLAVGVSNGQTVIITPQGKTPIPQTIMGNRTALDQFAAANGLGIDGDTIRVVAATRIAQSFVP